MHRPRDSVWRSMRSLGRAGAILILTTSALAADQQPVPSATGSAEALFIVQIVLLLLVGRLLGEAMQRIGSRR
jgi:Zn-dependent protease with chaperone function